MTAPIDYIAGSEAAQRALAENFVGLPLQRPGCRRSVRCGSVGAWIFSTRSISTFDT